MLFDELDPEEVEVPELVEVPVEPVELDDLLEFPEFPEFEVDEVLDLPELFDESVEVVAVFPEETVSPSLACVSSDLAGAGITFKEEISTLPPNQ